MSSELEKFLERLDAGETPAPLPPQEDLKRRETIIRALLDKMLDCARDVETEIVKAMKQAASLEELSPLIAKVGQAAEARYPGICHSVEQFIKRYDELAKLVPGAGEGGLS